MAGVLFAGAGAAGLALLAGCQLVLDFAPLDDAGPPDSGTPSDSGAPDAADLCDQLEPSDTLEGGFMLDPGTYQASICPAGDNDYYRFALDGSQDLAVDLTFEAGPNDLELELYDVNTSMLITLSTGFDGDERIERSLAVSGRLPAGSYAVRVFGRDGTIQNDYQLGLAIGAQAADAAP
jgi:hypothetical protein